MKTNGHVPGPKPVNQILKLLPLLNDRDLNTVRKEVNKISVTRSLSKSTDKKEIPGYRGPE